MPQLTGELRYHAFIPKPLPPNPRLKMDMEIQALLSDADRALGRLDGVTETLPDPNLFVAMYVRKEAVLSSQIEGTQASLINLLEYELEQASKGASADIGEVVNYVSAMNYGLHRLKDLPVSLRLIKEIHEKLLTGVRGADRNPGEFRSSQNWVGPPGCTILQATFVPPPPADMKAALGDLEKFLYDNRPMPLLVKIGLTHAQFETIHPFLDGNGRIGRLLITLLLCQRGILHHPLLYLSYYFKQNRAEYYDRLIAIRTKGDWEGWLKFFLQGVHAVAHQATDTARKINALRVQHSQMVRARVSGALTGLRLLDLLYLSPVLTVKNARETLNISYVSANNLFRDFEDLGILMQMTTGRRNRVFAYGPYLNLFLDEESPKVYIPLHNDRD